MYTLVHVDFTYNQNLPPTTPSYIDLKTNSSHGVENEKPLLNFSTEFITFPKRIIHSILAAFAMPFGIQSAMETVFFLLLLAHHTQ